MQLKTLLDQLRVDLVWKGVWAMKFFNEEGYRSFVTKYQECLFENTYGVEFNDANKVKVYGKEFIVWANPDKADDSVWEDAEDSFVKSPNLATLVRETHDLREEFEEAANEADDSVWEDAEDSFFSHMFSAHFRLRLLMNRCKRGGYMTSLMSLKELALLKRSSRTKSTGTTAVYRNRISPDPIFFTSEASSAGGFYAINRRGQVLLATVNESTIVPFVSGQLNNLELAVNLAKRGNLPDI